jgi:hypothetical protein
MAILEVQVWAEDEWRCRQHCIHGDCVPAQGDGPHEDTPRAVVEMCVCKADWIGRDCDTHAMAAFRYQPLQYSVTRASPADILNWNQPLFDQAIAAISETQNPGSCTSRTASIFRFENRWMQVSTCLLMIIPRLHVKGSCVYHREMPYACALIYMHVCIHKHAVTIMKSPFEMCTNMHVNVLEILYNHG